MKTITSIFTLRFTPLLRPAIIVTGLWLLTGCIGTQNAAPNILVQTNFVRIDTACATQVNQQQSALKKAQASQYLSLANTASHCIKDIPFSPKHPDVQTAMQFNALAFVNFVKAGDMQAASQSLRSFRQSFPQQDLFFDDYSSFVDTATALVKQHTLSQQQADLLNINPMLRAEMRRQRDWALN